MHITDLPDQATSYPYSYLALDVRLLRMIVSHYVSIHKSP